MTSTSTRAALRGIAVTLGIVATAIVQQAGASSPAPTPAADVRPAVESFRVLAFGSSSTQGIGASSPAASYPSRLALLFEATPLPGLAVTVVNRGIGGEDIDDMSKRLDTELQHAKPDLVVWQVGSNDSLRGVSLDRFKAELRNGVSVIRSTGAEVMLMEPQWSPKLEAADAANRFIDAVRNIGTEQHVAVVRRFDLMKRWMTDGTIAQADLVGPDGLHMTDKGYALLAKAVFDDITARSLAFRGRVAMASAALHR